MKNKALRRRSRPNTEDDDVLVRVLNSHVASTLTQPYDFAEEANSLLLHELETTQLELQQSRKAHQLALTDLTASLTTLQTSMQRRDEEVTGVITRAIRDLEPITASADAGIVAKGVIARLMLLVKGNKTEQYTDRTAQASLEQCRLRLEELKKDFRLVKEQKTKLEADFRRQLQELQEENARLKREITMKNKQEEDWDLPRQMQCASAAVSHEWEEDPAA